MTTRRERTLLASLSSRHFRKKNAICLVEGLRCCREAIARRPDDVIALFCTHAFIDSAHARQLPALPALPAPPTVIPDADFAAVSETETPQGILAVMKTPTITTAPQHPGTPFTLLLDQVADPGNLGTILRTAWAVGLDSCWLVKGTADPFSPKSIRSGMGAQFALTLHLFEGMQEAVIAAHSLGVAKVWCTMPSGGVSLFDDAFHLNNTLLVIGNEANGISRPELGTPVNIPMPGGAESLNAAQAATVFLVLSLKENKKLD